MDVTAWPVSPPWRLEPQSGGYNNLTWAVDSPDGQFFLRVYQNLVDPAAVRREHSLLLRLQREPLPFAVPAPVVARNGETLVALPDGLAALFPRIPGGPAERGNPAHIEAAGAALGDLHEALARLGAPADLSTYADLYRIHPAVPAPFAVPAALPISIEDQQALARLLHGVHHQLQQLRGTLPRQALHADYTLGNLLFVDGQVSGVLDFEFASYDFRALDLASCLYSCTGVALGTPAEWPLAEAVLRGYQSRIRLTPAEAEALPLLLQVVRVVSFLHWVGRQREGLSPVAESVRRAREVLDFADWLRERADRLVHLAKRLSVR